jgi:hypothetical protein
VSQLAKLQHAFQAYLLDDTLKSKNSFIVNDAKLGAKKRLGIYHDAYRLRIIEALGNTYGNVKKLLGDAHFKTTARAYLKEHPSLHPNLRWYGAHMPGFLKTALPQHPIAAELAAFEWALAITFDALDGQTLYLQDLATIAPENWGNLRFKFHSGLQFIELELNTVTVWKALQADETPPSAVPVEHHLWLIWRQHLDANFRSIDDVEAMALRLMMVGASFGELCEALFERMGDNATTQAAQYLAGWLEAQLISELI